MLFIYITVANSTSRYACLVAEPTATEEQKRELVGVVDVTVLRDDSVLRHLRGEEEYLYVSGIAVSESFRSVIHTILIHLYVSCRFSVFISAPRWTRYLGTRLQSIVKLVSIEHWKFVGMIRIWCISMLTGGRKWRRLYWKPAMCSQVGGAVSTLLSELMRTISGLGNCTPMQDTKLWEVTPRG